jgi:NTP pyrophosphatase (non-canonical NTP hydrolase)
MANGNGKLDYFLSALERIRNSTAREPKNSVLQMVKLTEEVGELAAEIIKREGYTYKDFSEEDFYSEMSDVIIMAFALYFKMAEEHGELSFKELIKVMHTKIDKWDSKLDKKSYRIQQVS